MSYTPVFDQTVAASDADIWLASHIFPVPKHALAEYVAEGLGVPLLTKNNPEWAAIDPRYHAKVTGSWITTTLTVKPQPAWRTFLRCLFWWLP